MIHPVLKRIQSTPHWRKWFADHHVDIIEKDGLALFSYNRGAYEANKWEPEVRYSRGTVIDLAAMKVVAWPWAKFFNLNEQPETMLEKLPQEAYSISDKLDGSLIIAFHHNGKWRCVTKGAFDSAQALAARMILPREALVGMTEYTLLFELIGPSNPVVVTYPEDELVLLGAFNSRNGEEMLAGVVDQHARVLGIRGAEATFDIIWRIIDEAKKDSGDYDISEEGWVVRFRSGLRVKIKKRDYLRVHRLLEGLSPRRVAEAWADGQDVNLFIPKNLRQRYHPLLLDLEVDLDFLRDCTASVFARAPKTSRRDFAEYVKGYGFAHVLYKMLDGLQGQELENLLRSHAMKMVMGRRAA